MATEGWGLFSDDSNDSDDSDDSNHLSDTILTSSVGMSCSNGI